MKKLFKEFTAAQLARLKKEYDPLKGQRIPMSQIDKMNTMLSKYSTDMLVKLANTDIPFLATAAKSIAVTKRGKKWSDFKTKLDMSEADELQCEACWDSHKQVGTKISSRTGKRVPNCVPKEELQEVLDLEINESIYLDYDTMTDDEFFAKYGVTRKEMGKADKRPGQKYVKREEKDLEEQKRYMLTYGKKGEKVKAFYSDDHSDVQKKASELRGKGFVVDKMGLKQPMSKLRDRIPEEVNTDTYADSKKKMLNKEETELVEFTLADYRELESDNQHDIAAKKLIDKFGTPQEKSTINDINRRHAKTGYISGTDFRLRTMIVNRYYSRLK